MNTIKTEGLDKGRIFLYALSTCIWCKKTKAFLEDNNIAFEYIFVDLLPAEEKETVKAELKKWNPACSYPTIIINDSTCIVGFEEDEIRKELSL